jgi:peroxiredoxin
MKSRLIGAAMPPVELAATDGSRVNVAHAGMRRAVLYLYPMAGTPGVPAPPGWAELPGAVGCTAQACGFRDHHAELVAAGCTDVYGLSAQSSARQQELVGRLKLPYPLLADPGLTLAAALDLPTFTVAGRALYQRLTLVVEEGVVRHCFYPVSDPAGHADQVVRWLTGNR